MERPQTDVRQRAIMLLSVLAQSSAVVFDHFRSTRIGARLVFDYPSRDHRYTAAMHSITQLLYNGDPPKPVNGRSVCIFVHVPCISSPRNVNYSVKLTSALDHPRQAVSANCTRSNLPNQLERLLEY